jgi:hypothetical protein
MWIEPPIGGAFIAAVAGLVAALIGLIPHVGVLHRLERVVNILEKVAEQRDREPLLAIRDRLIDRLRPRYAPAGIFYILAVVSFTAAAACIGVGVAQRTIWAGTGPAPFSGSLIVGGIVLLFAGLAFFLIALINARQLRGPRRSVSRFPKRPATRR